MKNHKELFDALLAGEVLQSKTGPNRKIYFENNYLSLTGFNDYNLAIITYADFEIKPKTININGFEVPEPVREKPLDGTIYYIVTLDSPNLTLEWLWSDDDSDRDSIKKGIAHLTKEAAELHAKALLSFSAK